MGSKPTIVVIIIFCAKIEKIDRVKHPEHDKMILFCLGLLLKCLANCPHAQSIGFSMYCMIAVDAFVQ